MTEKPNFRLNIPGITLCSLLSFFSIYLSKFPLWPFTLPSGSHPFDAVMVALILGILVRNTISVGTLFSNGIEFSLKVLLPLSIVLLGARLKISDLLDIGGMGILLTIFTILFVFLIFFSLRKMTSVSSDLLVLLATGTAICGGSAILAAAPVLRARKSDVVFSVATVACVGLLLMFALPLIGSVTDMDPIDYGLLTGLSIHQTPQVIAAGFACGEEAGKIAITVKLARVSMLAPLLLIMGVLLRRKQSVEPSSSSQSIRTRALPFFLYGFMLMAALRSLDWLPVLSLTESLQLDTTIVASDTSRFLMIVSMAALGLETRVGQIRDTGGGVFMLSCLVSVLLLIALYFLLGFLA